MKPKNNFLEQLRRSREAAKPEHKDHRDHAPLEGMTADELEAERKDLEISLIREKSREYNERFKARVLGETQEAPGGYPQGKPQLFPLQKSRRHWR
jgi:hypothetical protein